MPGLVPGIHAFLRSKAWMAGTGPAMTEEKKGKNRMPESIADILRNPV